MFEEIKYKQNYLTTVICRVDFADQLSEKAIDKVLTVPEITTFFSIKSKDQIKEDSNISVVEKPGGSTEISKSSDKFIIKTLVNSTGKNKLIISKKHLILEYNQYDSFEETKKHFSYIVNATTSCHPEIRVGRFGLRYINVFDSDKCKINKNFFSEKIRSLVKTEDFTGMQTSRAMGTIECVRDNVRLLMKYGNFNRNFPGIIEKYDFVLDFDASIAGLIPLVDIYQQKLDCAHDMIQTAFEESITENLRKIMR